MERAFAKRGMLLALLAIVLVLVLWARFAGRQRAQTRMDAAVFVSAAPEWRDAA